MITKNCIIYNINQITFYYVPSLIIIIYWWVIELQGLGLDRKVPWSLLCLTKGSNLDERFAAETGLSMNS